MLGSVLIKFVSIAVKQYYANYKCCSRDQFSLRIYKEK